MRDDTAVLITRAERKGASFRVRESQVEVRGLGQLPAELVNELRERKVQVLQCLSAQDAPAKDAAQLLAWASALSEQDLNLPEPIEYVESSCRKVKTRLISWYASHYLKTIVAAWLYQKHPKLCWGVWTSEWWREREEEALGALVALRQAMEAMKEQADHDH